MAKRDVYQEPRHTKFLQQWYLSGITQWDLNMKEAWAQGYRSMALLSPFWMMASRRITQTCHAVMILGPASTSTTRTPTPSLNTQTWMTTGMAHGVQARRLR